LDVLADYQKRIADAMVERERSEVRIAVALESIAKMMGRHLGVEDLSSQQNGAKNIENDSWRNATEPGDNQADKEYSDVEGQPDLIGMIESMRGTGDSWEKIARHFDEQNIATISGKGKWRGPAVKKFWEANT